MIEVNKVYNCTALDLMAQIEDNSIDTIITDPPYGIKFKGNKWDYKLPDDKDIGEMLRILKPGGTLLCFGGTRTYHRMACKIEDAGFYISDMISWLHHQGFPKSVDISYMIDKNINHAFGKEIKQFTVGNPMDSKQDKKTIKATAPYNDISKKWYGWGTALKPAWEPIIVANKHIEGNYEDNAIKWDIAGYHIDSCKIGDNESGIIRTSCGFWPSNVIHDGLLGNDKYFYCAKPNKEERENCNHPTMKPIELISYLCRLTRTPDGGIVYDPYGGSGTTAIACIKTDRKFVVSEKDSLYYKMACDRIESVKETQGELF